jgi:autotransporter-associated beta strand protein
MKLKNQFFLRAVTGSTLILSLTQAATVVWDGGAAGTGTTLETASNWVGDALPSVAADTIQWNGTVAGPLSLSYASGLGGTAGNIGLNVNLTSAQTSAVSIDSATNTAIRLNNVTLDSGAGAFTLGNGTGSGASAFAITLGGATNQTHTWSNNSTNTATINNDVLFGLGGGGIHALQFTGSGNWDVKNNLTVSNAATTGVQFSLQKTGAGTLTLSGGGSLKAGPVAFGSGTTGFGAVFKAGITNITGGNYAFNSSELVVGGLDVAGTNTQLNLSNAGAITGVSWLSIGRGNGAGAVSSNLTLNNTSSVAANDMSGGFNAGNTSTAPKGVVTLNDSSTLTVVSNVQLGESVNSDITLNINGTSTFSQTSTTGGSTRLGMANGAKGTINVGGGTANFQRDLVLGSGGTGSGKLVLNSGIVNMASTTERWLIVGNAAGASGQIDVNGGELRLNTNTDIRMGVGAVAATGVVNLNAGAITGYVGNGTGGFSTTSLVDMQNQGAASSSNTFNLNGGTLTIGQVISTATTGTRTFNFNGGTLKAAGANVNFFNIGTGSATASVKSGGAIIDSNGFDVTVVNSLVDGTGGGGLTKNGAGTLTLSGAASTYTGATNVNVGTLRVNGNLTSNISVANAATLSGNGSTTGTASFATGATLSVDPVAGDFAAAGVNFAGSTTLFFSSALTTGNTYDVITYAGGTLSGTSNLVKTSRGNFADTGTKLTFTAGGVLTDTWNAVSGTWQIGVSTPWSNGFDGEFWNSDTVVFDDTTGVDSTATIVGNVVPAAVNVSGATNHTFAGSGAISGSAAINKTGTGTLTIGNVNTHTGALTISEGTVVSTVSGGLSTAAATVLAGGTLNLGGISQTSGAFSIAAAAASGDTVSNGTLNPTSTTVSNASGNAIVSAAIGAGPLVKTGAGTLTMSGGANFNGGINAFGGSFVSVLKEGQTEITAGTYSYNNGELVVGGLDAVGTNSELKISNAGALTNMSWLSIGRGNGTGATSSNVSLYDTSSISAANMSAGFNGGNAATAPKSVISLNNSSSWNIGSGGGFFVAESPGSHVTMNLSGSSAVTINGNGTAINRSIGHLGTGILNVSGSANFTDQSNLALNIGFQGGVGEVNINGATAQFNHPNGEVRVGAANANGAFTGGSGTITITEGNAVVGALTLARGNNSAAQINGTVNVNGGTFTSTGDVVLGYAGAGNVGRLNVNGGTFNVGTTASKWLQVGSYDTAIAEVVIGSGNLNLNTNSAIKMSRQNGTGAHTFSMNGGNVTYFSDNATTVGGTGDLDLQYVGAATTNNTFHLNGGVLTVPKIITTTDSGTVALNLNGGTIKATNNEANFLTLGGENQKVYVKSGGAVIDTNGYDITIAEGLVDGGGNGGLTKNGEGTLTLSGTSTYTGTTTVNAGTLYITGALASTNFVVEAGATVAGNGTISSDVTLDAGAELNLTGATIDLAGSSNILTVGLSNSITLTDFGFANIVGWDAASAADGTYTLINGASSVTFNGTTPTAATPFWFVPDVKKGYFQQGSLQAVIVTVPEISSALLGVLGASCVFLRRRRNAN